MTIKKYTRVALVAISGVAVAGNLHAGQAAPADLGTRIDALQKSMDAFNTTVNDTLGKLSSTIGQISTAIDSHLQAAQPPRQTGGPLLDQRPPAPVLETDSSATTGVVVSPTSEVVVATPAVEAPATTKEAPATTKAGTKKVVRRVVRKGSSAVPAVADSSAAATGETATTKAAPRRIARGSVGKKSASATDETTTNVDAATKAAGRRVVTRKPAATGTKSASKSPAAAKKTSASRAVRTRG